MDSLMVKDNISVISFLLRPQTVLKIYKNLYPQGSQPGVLYGLSKIYKQFVNNIPKLRPISSALNRGTYKWAKCFVPLFCLSNEHTLKDSFEFAKVICEQNSDLYLASLDIDSLFSNVPLDENIGILRFVPKDYLKVRVLFVVLTRKCSHGVTIRANIGQCIFMSSRKKVV